MKRAPRVLIAALALVTAQAQPGHAVTGGSGSPSWAHASDGHVQQKAIPQARSGASAMSSSGLQGIDISHWNGTIDWPKVAGSGKRFVIMKATDGRRYVDPTYAQNRRGAISAGLVVTAYHFARPDSSSGDAAAEADHFVDVAGIEVGDIIPALDLERDGGLSTQALINWAAGWLREVKRRTRITPMIYTGPYRWSTKMADTAQFADAGYRLWLAHWTTGQPWVPAHDWGGHGWTFWQHGNCGTVPGIGGCVDQDRFDGTSLKPVVVPRLAVTTNRAGAVTSKPRGIDCGSRCRSAFDPGSTVRLEAAPDPGAVLVRWKGACSGFGDCPVRMVGNHRVDAVFGFRLSASVDGNGSGSVTTSAKRIDCGSAGNACSGSFAAGEEVTLTATPDPGSQFAGWSGDCTGWELTCTLRMDAARSVGATFADDTPPTASIHGQTTLHGGTVAAFDEPVHGVSISNFILRPQEGRANLPASVACRDETGATTKCGTGEVARAILRSSTPLVLGQDYEAVVNPTGVPMQVVDRAGNPSPRTLAPFRAATSIEESSVRSGWGWRRVRNGHARGGSYRTADLAGASASLSFAGRTVTWWTVTGPAEGEARVMIDGRGRGVVDLSGAVRRFDVSHRFGGLGPGTHDIRVVVLGRRGAHGPAGRMVPIDGFRVGRAEVLSRDISYRWATRSAPRASGGAYATEADAGASLRIRFRGTAIRWITLKGPGQGKASVYVDGRLHAVYDGYAARRTYGVSRAAVGLSDAVHTLRIVVLGKARPAASGRAVCVDAFRVA